MLLERWLDTMYITDQFRLLNRLSLPRLMDRLTAYLMFHEGIDDVTTPICPLQVVRLAIVFVVEAEVCQISR